MLQFHQVFCKWLVFFFFSIKKKKKLVYLSPLNSPNKTQSRGFYSINIFKYLTIYEIIVQCLKSTKNLGFTVRTSKEKMKSAGNIGPTWRKADWRWLKMAEFEPDTSVEVWRRTIRLHKPFSKEIAPNVRRVISVDIHPSATSTVLWNLVTKGSCVRKTKRGSKLIKHHEGEQTF